MPQIASAKRLVIIITLTVFASLFSVLSIECPAMDRAGCLTCHQYSGLVTQEKPLGPESIKSYLTTILKDYVPPKYLPIINKEKR